MHGSSPLDLLETAGQCLLMGIPNCGSVFHDGLEEALVAVSVNAGGAASESDVCVDKHTDLVGLWTWRCCLDVGTPVQVFISSAPRYFSQLTLSKA